MLQWLGDSSSFPPRGVTCLSDNDVTSIFIRLWTSWEFAPKRFVLGLAYMYVQIRLCCHVFYCCYWTAHGQVAASIWLSDEKATSCEEFVLLSTLDLSQQRSMWANHAVTRKQSLKSKIWDYEVWDIVALCLHCTRQCLAYSGCLWETRVVDLQIHTRTHTHTHKPTTVCLRVSAHRGITICNATLVQGQQKVGILDHMKIFPEKI